MERREHSRQVLEVPLADIKLVDNPRIHPEREIEGIMESIKKYGYMDPVHLSKSDNTLIEGYARVEACKRLGIEKIPALHMDLKTSEYNVVMILGNRLAELAQWDYQMFIKMVEDTLDDKREPVPELGFSAEEIDNIKVWQNEEGSKTGLEIADYVEVPPISAAEQVRGSKTVEIILTYSLELWEKNRVEIEGDLVTMASKFEGLKFSPPKMRVVQKKVEPEKKS